VTSEVDICNRALASIGAQSTVSSINPSDGSSEANVASLLYAPTRDSLLRTIAWNFARKQIALTQLKSAYDTAPTIAVPWLYEYAYPADCLDVRFILAGGSADPTTLPPMTTGMTSLSQQTATGDYPQFIVASDTDTSGNPIKVILTDQYQATLVYTARSTNPDLWDAMFADALVASLSAKFVNPLARNAQMMVEQTKIAERIIAEAKAKNANEGMPLYSSHPDWMRARGGSPRTYRY
jgi:hypothetical protein